MDSPFYVLDKLSWDKKITANSVFPEWIKTERIRFERLTEKAVSPGLLKSKRERHPEYDKYFPTKDKKKADFDSVLEWYEYADKLWEERTDAFYVMLEKETREFIGTAYIEDVDFGRSVAFLGIWLDEDYRGEGYAQERAEALSFICFNHLDIDVVKFKVVTDNIPSVKSVTKSMELFGGSFSGKLKNHTHIPSGEVKDVYIWSLEKEEYEVLDKTYESSISPTDI